MEVAEQTFHGSRVFAGGFRLSLSWPSQRSFGVEKLRV